MQGHEGHDEKARRSQEKNEFYVVFFVTAHRSASAHRCDFVVAFVTLHLTSQTERFFDNQSSAQLFSSGKKRSNSILNSS